MNPLYTFEDLFGEIQIDANNGVIFNQELYLDGCRRIANQYIRLALDKSFRGEDRMETALKYEDIK